MFTLKLAVLLCLMNLSVNGERTLATAASQSSVIRTFEEAFVRGGEERLS